jgi:hypothetical protein
MHRNDATGGAPRRGPRVPGRGGPHPGRRDGLPRAWLAALVTLVAACSSATPGGAHLYDDGDPPGLLHASIRMETRRSPRSSLPPDLRTIVCHDGRITATYRSEATRKEGTGPIPFEEYAKLWDLLRSRTLVLEAEEIDPAGGPYHFVTHTLGTKTHSFSAQDRTNFLGLATETIRDRLDATNAIATLVHEYVEVHDMPPEETGAAEDDGAR